MSQALASLRFRITKRFAAKTVLDDFALEVRGRAVRDAAGTERLRQVHCAQHRRGPHSGERRRALDRRRAHGPSADREARVRHGVPELCAVPAYDRVRQHRVRPGAAAAGRRPRSGERVRRDAQPGAAAGVRRALSLRSFRAASSSGSRSPARWCCTRACSCSTSRCPTSTPSCASRCAPRSSASTPTSA